MGCVESREQSAPQGHCGQPLLSTLPHNNDDEFLVMGQPQPAQQPPRLNGPAQLSSQHERLILELLPFKEPGQFHEWLSSVYVRGSWDEFVRDFLSRHPHAPELDKAKVAQKAKDALNSRAAMYLMYHPDKSAWTAEEHQMRFIVAVVADNMLGKGLWSESDWKKRGLEIAKAVYEVLAFLRATAFSSSQDAEPPRYEA